tara:strand:- start:380 stop:565 length:186 start_codon:yes stop_codon:yes gene_type:complete
MSEKIEFVEYSLEASLLRYKEELENDLKYHQSEVRRVKKELQEINFQYLETFKSLNTKKTA